MPNLSAITALSGADLSFGGSGGFSLTGALIVTDLPAITALFGADFGSVFARRTQYNIRTVTFGHARSKDSGNSICARGCGHGMG